MSVNEQALPWLSKSFTEKIADSFNNHHAVLLSGAAGIGKSYLASILMHGLFTQATQAEKKLLDAGTHPDVHALTSAHAFQSIDSSLKNLCWRYLDQEAMEKKRLSRQIPVNTIRNLIESMNESSSSNCCKLAIICPAEDMNINSANALLKFLEEPTARTYLILVSHDISRLTATIRSRCLRINLGLPDVEISKQWLSSIFPGKSGNEVAAALSLAQDRPLLAREYLRGDQQAMANEIQSDIAGIASGLTCNTVAIARKWIKYKQTDFILQWICQLFAHLIKARMQSTTDDPFLAMSRSFTYRSLFDIYDHALSIKQEFDGVVDETLIIEDLLQTIAVKRHQPI